MWGYVRLVIPYSNILACLLFQICFFVGKYRISFSSSYFPFYGRKLLAEFCSKLRKKSLHWQMPDLIKLGHQRLFETFKSYRLS